MEHWIEDIPSAVKGHRKFIEWLVKYVNPKTIVELGVDYGYSTFVFSNALPYGLNNRVYSIDWFKGDESTGYRNTRKEVEDLIIEHKIDNVVIVQGDFNEIVTVWSKEIDILFIDGSHDYNSVLNDFCEWSRYVGKDGVILMHDTNIEEFGVKKLFSDIEGYYKLEFLHSAGLGILLTNKELHDTIENLFFNVPF